MRLAVPFIACSAISILSCAGDGTEPQTVVSVVVTPSTSTLVSLDATVHLTASARDGNGNTIPGKTFSWSSSSENIATVSTTGVVTAVSNGSAMITATVDAVSGSASLTVSQAVASVEVSPLGQTLTNVASTAQLTARATDANGHEISDQSFAWVSLNPYVVSVSGSGEVTAVASGQGTVSATADGVTAYALVTAAVPSTTPVSTWTQLNSGTTEFLRGVWGTSSTDVYAAGDGGTILHYDGTAWGAMTSGVTASLHRVWGLGADDVYVVGVSGTILRYDGSAWRPMTSGTNGALRGVWGTSPADIFAVGLGATILHYDGVAWSAMTSPTTEVLYHLWGTSSRDVFALGTQGVIIHYNGSDWSMMSSGTTRELLGVWGTSPSNVFAVGALGTILHYDGSGWAAMVSGTDIALLAVWGTSPDDVYAFGTAGTIVHYDGTEWTAAANGPNDHIWGAWGTSTDVIATGIDGLIIRGAR